VIVERILANFTATAMKLVRGILFTTLLLLTALACRKIDLSPSWDVELLAPIAQSRISLDQLLSQNELRTNSDGESEVFFEGEIFSYSLDSLFRIPDTSITKVNQGNIIPITINPTQTWASDTNNSRFQIKDVSLLEAELADGKIVFEISSNITEPIDMVYVVPGATKDGQVLNLSRTIPAAAGTNSPSVIRDSIDLTGYRLDLRGKDANTANTIYFYFSATVAANANPVSIGNLQNVTLTTSYKNLLPYYGRGYFRQQVLAETGTAEDFDVFSNLPSGEIDLDEIELIFDIKNAIGVDISAEIEALTALNTSSGKSVELSGPGKNQILNLNRATEQSGLDPPVFPQFRTHTINTDNSNLDELLEILPDQMNYQLNLEINPLGAVSGGNDFIYLNTGIDIDLNARVPLRFKATNLIYLDTLELQLDPDEKETTTDAIYEGSLFLKTQNTFPVDVEPVLYFLDSNQVIKDSIFSDEQVLAYLPNSESEFSQNILEFVLRENQVDALYDYPNILLKLRIQTGGPNIVSFKPDQYLQVVLSADFRYKMNTGAF